MQIIHLNATFVTLPGCEETHAAGPKPGEKRRVGVGELTPLCKKMRKLQIKINYK